jgi:hypothetical protein
MKAPLTLTVTPEVPAPEEWNAMLVSPKAACFTPYANARYLTEDDLVGLLTALQPTQKRRMIAALLEINDLYDINFVNIQLLKVLNACDHPE